MASGYTWERLTEMAAELYTAMEDGATLTSWEHDFINSMTDYEESGTLFSSNEELKIVELHSKFC